MTTDLLDLYRQASDWTAEKVAGTTDLDAATPCDGLARAGRCSITCSTRSATSQAPRSATDEAATEPDPPPLSTRTRQPTSRRPGRRSWPRTEQDGVIEKTGPALGIAFSDQLLHGWDLARATNQDATMPDGLAQAAYELIHGAFTDEQRKGVFKPEIAGRRRRDAAAAAARLHRSHARVARPRRRNLLPSEPQHDCALPAGRASERAQYGARQVAGAQPRDEVGHGHRPAEVPALHEVAAHARPAGPTSTGPRRPRRRPPGRGAGRGRRSRGRSRRPRPGC